MPLQPAEQGSCAHTLFFPNANEVVVDVLFFLRGSFDVSFNDRFHIVWFSYSPYFNRNLGDTALNDTLPETRNFAKSKS